MKVTLDASVWLASLVPSDPGHADGQAVLKRLVERRVPIHQPGLFVSEVCATVARRTGDRGLAIEAGRAVLLWPFLAMHEMGHALAASAADIAARCAMRGADAVYVATARAAGSTLVTLDREMRERGASVVTTTSPADWLAAFPSSA